LNYMSPEHIHDAKWADQRSDVYSLGATMYHMLTGEAAFPGSDLVSKVTSIQKEDPPSPKGLRPEVPDALCSLLQRMMAKKPDDRYQTPKEVVNDLRTIRNLLSRQPVSTQ
ncbi:MAG: protein kinase, partial [Planctomycetota bacterium]|nr:protein kinase [Planctomycetota bacterium]